MISEFKRKFRRLTDDPVLRRWLTARLLRRVPGPAAFTAHTPPYAEGMLPLPLETPTVPGDAAPHGAMPGDVSLPLAGARVNIDRDDTGRLFDGSFDDIEATLSLHRFAWLPMVDGEIADSVLPALWDGWSKRHGTPDDGWAWHPYTAAERVINILDYVRRRGWPGDPDRMARALAAHAPEIARRLEYFGVHDTSNHLANNGRGLFRLGCALELTKAADLGSLILRREAERLFGASGMLREGSSHYHLLYLRNYLDAWLCAGRHGRSGDAAAFKETARRAAGAAKAIRMPGRMPLIGDISPDCPPAFLGAIFAGAGGWLDLLDTAEREEVAALVAKAPEPSPGALDADGWVRAAFDGWDGLWHAPGWPQMPGHGHQDTGAAELHYRGEPVFVDPGRGRYGEEGGAGLYAASAVHGTLTLDGRDPFPANKPYYDDEFRGRIAGTPVRRRFGKGIEIRHDGYRRIGAGTVTRRWTFHGDDIVLDDEVSGRSANVVERALVTPLAAEKHGNGVRLTGDGAAFVIEANDATPILKPITIWSAYGEGKPGTRIAFKRQARMPWRGTINIRIQR